MYYTLEWFHCIIYVFKTLHIAINKWLNLLIHWFWILLGNLTRLLTRLISVLFFSYQINFFIEDPFIIPPWCKLLLNQTVKNVFITTSVFQICHIFFYRYCSQRKMLSLNSAEKWENPSLNALPLFNHLLLNCKKLAGIKHIHFGSSDTPASNQFML